MFLMFIAIALVPLLNMYASEEKLPWSKELHALAISLRNDGDREYSLKSHIETLKVYDVLSVQKVLDRPKYSLTAYVLGHALVARSVNRDPAELAFAVNSLELLSNGSKWVELSKTLFVNAIQKLKNADDKLLTESLRKSKVLLRNYDKGTINLQEAFKSSIELIKTIDTSCFLTYEQRLFTLSFMGQNVQWALKLMKNTEGQLFIHRIFSGSPDFNADVVNKQLSKPVIQEFIHDYTYRRCDVCGKETKIKCSICKKSYYCNAECQKKDFLEHKVICKK